MRWLLGKDDAITEPDLAVRRVELWCTPRGQFLFLPGVGSNTAGAAWAR